MQSRRESAGLALCAVACCFLWGGWLGGALLAAEPPRPLTIAEKSRIVVNKETHLIVVLDLKPSAEALKAAAAAADTLVIVTAENYAREYLSKTEYAAVPKAIVYLIAVNSMDEYNRANFDGMKRFGTLTFDRRGADVSLVDNKLALNTSP